MTLLRELVQWAATFWWTDARRSVKIGTIAPVFAAFGIAVENEQRFEEEFLVFNRVQFVGVAIVVCLLVGCSKTESPKSDEEAQANTASKVKVHYIENVTLDQVKSELGSDFAVKVEGPPTVLERQVDGHDIIVIVNNNDTGRVRSVSAHIVSPEAANAQQDELYEGTARQLITVLGVSDSEALEKHIQIGNLRTRMGFGYNFSLGQLYFDWLPRVPAVSTSKVIPAKPAHLERALTIIRKRGASSSPSSPIPGASLAQLESLLDGFEMKVDIEGEQRMYVRESDTHADVVHCKLSPKNEIVSIAAFAGDVKGGADFAELNSALWRVIAGLEFDGSDPAKVIEFLDGPRGNPTYGGGVDVGGISFFLPAEKEGFFRRFTIFNIGT